MDEAVAWQNRPLEATYAIVYFDALRVKIRDEGLVRNKAVYLAIGVNCAGAKEILGLWIEQTEGAKFWMRVMTEIRSRGTTDVLIAVVDGLKGFPEAITAVFPDTVVQTCIVHLIRYSMQFASWKERKAIAKDFKPIYAAPRPPQRPSMPSRKVPGARSTHRSLPAGAASGSRSSRSLRSRRRFARSSTRPTRSRACTARCARRYETRGTSRATTRRPS